jgi:hypothetical protein
MATYQQPQPAATPARASNQLFTGFIIGVAICIAILAMASNGFDTCLRIYGGHQIGELTTRDGLLCGFRL